MTLKILLPVDGSAAALQAVRHALDLVRQGLDASFVLANVQEAPTLYEVVVGHDPETLAAVRAGAGADLLAPAEALLQQAGCGYDSEVAGGDPHHTLLEMAERYGCDAIVMGARSEGEGGPGALGSVALAVLQHAAVPVTLVRAPEPADAADAEDREAGPEGG
jgi:nucleotide-binding universal stress UspA family protein